MGLAFWVLEMVGEEVLPLWESKLYWISEQCNWGYYVQGQKME